MEMCSILNKTSSLDVIIGNLKPQNILFDEKSNIVLCDYCQYLLKQKDQGISIDEMRYMSPEMLEGKSIGIASDIWSLGCVIYYIKTKRNMFDDSNQQGLVKKIENCEYEKLKDDNVNELLEHIIIYDEERRYRISEINEYLKEKKIVNYQNRKVYLPSTQSSDHSSNSSIKSLLDEYNSTKDRDILNLLIKRCIKEGEYIIIHDDEIVHAILSSIKDENEMLINDRLLASDIVREISNNINIYESLEILKIENTTLDEGSISLVCNIIPHFTNLKTLSLRSVSPIKAFSFVVATELPKLLSLDLSHNNFTIESSNSLKNSLKYMPNLEYLNLENVTTFDDIIYPVIEVIPQLKHLKTLNISGNAVSEIEIEEIDELIKYNHLLYVAMADEVENQGKEFEWNVVYDSDSNVTKITKRIKNKCNKKNLSTVLQPFAKSLNIVIIDLNNITNENLKEIAEIPTTYIRIKNIQFSHYYTKHSFTSDGLKVLLPLLSSQVITLDIFIAYCINYIHVLYIYVNIVINEANIIQDNNYYKNINEMCKYKEIEEIKRKYENINEVTINNLESESLFKIVSSIPHINVLRIKNLSSLCCSDGNSICDKLMKLTNVGYIEVENVDLKKKELNSLIDLIEKGRITPSIIRNIFRCFSCNRVPKANKLCKKILSKENISKRAKIVIKRIKENEIGDNRSVEFMGRSYY